MSNDDVAILTPILLVAIAALIVVCLRFRNAATTPDALVSPMVFGVCGALIGISAGMLWLADRHGQVTIDRGIGGVVSGGLLGVLLGMGARQVYPRLKRGKAAALVLVAMLLGGSIGAPIGWIAGDMGAAGASRYDTQSDYEHAAERFRVSGMGWGAALGSAVGLGMGLTEVLCSRPRSANR